MTDTAIAPRRYPVPQDEDDRLIALAEYAILDGPAEPDLELIAQLAADLCGTPRAVVNIMAAEHQHQVAAVGMEPTICSRNDSMCAVSLVEPESVTVDDARTDARFASNPHVNGVLDNIRLYAASQLRVEGGHVLGTLCVFDDAPRTLTPSQRAGLDRLARMAVDVLELRRHGRLVSEAMQAQEQALTELRQTHRELVRSNNALQQFAGQVSHDLKNPLTGLLGFITSLSELAPLVNDPTAKWMLDRALSSGTRMWRMIEDVLDHAALNGRPDFGPVPLAGLVSHVLEDLGDAVEQAGARIDVEPLPSVTGNATQLRVLLQNLIGNSLKYRDPGRPCVIRVTADARPGMQSVSVIDNGRGIPPDDRDRVTELFARAHTDVEGTGIGLATCQRIAATHHGTLSIGDTPGGGTTVTLILPSDNRS